MRGVVGMRLVMAVSAVLVRPFVCTRSCVVLLGLSGIRYLRVSTSDLGDGSASSVSEGPTVVLMSMIEDPSLPESGRRLNLRLCLSVELPKKGDE